MRDRNSQKNGRQLTIVRGGIARQPVRLRTRAEIELDDRQRAAYQDCVARHGAVPSRAVQEILEGRQNPWRKNAARAIEMLSAGVPTSDARMVFALESLAWFDEHAHEFSRPDPDPVAANLGRRKHAA